MSVEFETSVAQWLDENCPASMRTPMSADETVWGGRLEKIKQADSQLWLQRMADKGWLAPCWPRSYGGADLSAAEAKILQRQLSALGCRPALMSLGIPMMGPTIMEFGSEAQKLEFLPDIAQGKIRWCQGYSEPGAGSDLASLNCRAEKLGDHFLVTGQKVWTSYADKSDYLFCLVRTDFSVPKHQGISVLLIDMQSAGVNTKPIELISGSSHFCEVFLDKVVVPAGNLLGELNGGWSIAKRMLQHERSMMGQMDLGGNNGLDVVSLAKQYLGERDGHIADAVARDRLAANSMQLAALESTGLRIAAEMKQGAMSGASSVLKYAMTLAHQEKSELLLEMLGSNALGWQGTNAFTKDELLCAKEWAFSKIQTIGGGTSEIQLNIIAKQLLQLPE